MATYKVPANEAFPGHAELDSRYHAGALPPREPSYYHGSSHEFRPGEAVEPGHVGHDMMRDSHAYFTPDIDAARTFARIAQLRDKAPLWHVYQVGKPETYEDDPGSSYGYRTTEPLRITRHEESGSGWG